MNADERARLDERTRLVSWQMSLERYLADLVARHRLIVTADDREFLKSVHIRWE